MRKLLIFLSAILFVLIGLWGTLVLYFDEARLKQIAIEQVRAQTGRELQIDGALRLALLPRISLLASDVKLSGPDGFDGPNLFEADEFRMSLELWPLLRGRIETGDISLDNARLVIHTDRSGRNSLDGLSGDPGADDRPEADSARPAVTTGKIALSRARLTMSDAATDARQLFVVERLQIDSFAFDRPFRFEFQGGIGDPPMIDKIDVRGTLVVPSATGPIRITELGLTAEAAGLPLGLSGKAEINPGPPLLARFDDGVLDLNGKSFQTSFSYRDGDRPGIDATLSGEQINVDALLAMMPGSDEALADPEEAESPLLLLRELDLDARLKLDQMILAGLTINAVEARLRSARGLVTIDPLRGNLPGGRIDAVAMADLTIDPPLIQLDPVFDLEELGDALEPWGFQQFLSGSGILELGLSARGLDIDSILASLDGSGRYEFRDGAIQGLDLDGMVQGLAARNIAEAVRSGVGGSTAFETLTGAIEVRDGSVGLPGMSLITRLLGVRGDVRLGLADLALDGELRLDGERVDEIPVRLGGTLLAPKLTPDVGEALKQEAGRRVLELLQKRGERNKKSDDGRGDGG